MQTLDRKPKRINKKGTFATLPMLDGRRKRHEPALEPLPAGEDTQFDTTDDFEDEVVSALGNERLGKRVVSLIRNDYPYGTVPEMIFLDFLEERGTRYKYQAKLFGGYRPGGVIPDFLVNGNAIFVNGVYWHNIPGRQQKDATDKLRVVGQYFDGEIITRSTILWEDALMGASRRQVMQDALLGVEHPR